MSFVRKLFGQPDPDEVKRQQIEADVRALVRPHVQTLAATRARLFRHDPYGTSMYRRWDEEVALFCITEIDPKIGFDNLCALYPAKDLEFNDLLERILSNVNGDSPLWEIIDEEINSFERQGLRDPRS